MLTRNSLTVRLLPICLIPFFFLTTAVRGVDPNWHLSQYAHTAWRIQEGIFNGMPNVIAQTTDGYLWIGTQTGLVRFDGVRFVPWTPPRGKQLFSSTSIYSLLAGNDGSLWIGTGTNLAHWKDGDLINYANTRGRINSIIQDRKGTIWIARSRVPDTDGPLCQVIDTKLRCYGKADGIKYPYGGPLLEDAQGNFWIGSASALTRWSPGSTETYFPRGLKGAEGLDGVQALAAAPDGSLWIGMVRHGPGLGLQQMANGVWKPFVTPELDGTALEITTFLVDSHGALWIGTQNTGIYRIHEGKVDRFSSSDGLSSDAVNGFYEDREGNVWVTTTEGIDRFRDLRVVSYSAREGLSASVVDSVLASRDGTIWIGNDHAVDFLRGAKISGIQAKDGLPGVRVTSLLEDHAGRLWVGVDNGLSVYENGKFTPVKNNGGTKLGAIIALAEDSENNIWAEALGNPRHLLRIQDRVVREELPEPKMPAANSLVPDLRGGIWLGLTSGDLARYNRGQLETFTFKHAPVPAVRQIFAGSDGAVFGTTSAGLIGRRNGVQRILTVQNGLPCDTVYAAIADAEGALWLYSKCGLMRIANTELQKWWGQGDANLEVKLFDVLDGDRPAAASFQPSASRSSDGRLWFVNGIVLQTIDPAHIATNWMTPPVHVEEVIADRKSYAPQEGLPLPSLTRDLEIDYTALSLAVPQKVRFRYKLEGHDASWQEPGTRRQAFYTDLRPGKYRFQVMACNDDGIWNEAGATLDFSIAPAWFQTNWFRASCVVLLVSLVWALYRLRVRQIAHAISARFDERLAERTRIARELHDTFLQTIQGSKMVADDALEQPGDSVRMCQALEQLSAWLGQATQEGRAALNSLRSSTTQKNDLADAFQRATQNGLLPNSMRVNFTVVGDAREMHPIVRDEVYRIGYEAIRNAYMHSGASRLDVELKYAHDLTVRVSDNGVGIDPSVSVTGKDGHFGLQGMRERAARIGGKLSIDSSANTGTDITVLVPGGIVFRKANPTFFERWKGIFGRTGRDGTRP